MRRLAPLAVALALAVAGCDGDYDGGAPRPERPEQVVRAWIAALNAGDFDRAAGLFARGAIVEQTQQVRLPDRAAAEAFNRGLPCRADVTDIEGEGGRLLADFRLREGRDGQCAEGGSAQVRFVIRDGKIREWRQIPSRPIAPGEIAGLPAS